MSLDHHPQDAGQGEGQESDQTSVSKTPRAPRPRRASKSRRDRRPLVGWREWAVLPLLAPDPVQVKIDTGAATSSLHAHDLEIFEVTNDLDLDSDPGSVTIARFAFRPGRESNAVAHTAEVPVVAFRKIKSSNGQSQLRPVVRTPIILGTRQFDIDLTLADRDAMGYRMLLGRRAVRRRFLVDPGKSFLLDQPDADHDRSTA